MIPITLRVFHFCHSTRSRTKPEGCTPKTGPSKSTITNCMMKRNSIRGNLSSMRHTIITPFPSLLFKHFAEKELSTKTQELPSFLSLPALPLLSLSVCLRSSILYGLRTEHSVVHYFIELQREPNSDSARFGTDFCVIHQ